MALRINRGEKSMKSKEMEENDRESMVGRMKRK